MICTACGKESNNRRVCPYCFTPYPAEGPQNRQSTSVNRPSTPKTAEQAGDGGLGQLEPLRAFVMKQTPVVRWSAAGIIIVGLLWLLSGGEEPAAQGPVGVAANVQAAPMTREEATELIKRTRESALVEEQAGEVSVSYPAATFPVDEAGQALLVTQFARADETVEGRKRRIFYYSPSGRMFAQSDGVTGVTMMK